LTRVKLVWEKYYPNSVPHLAREKGSFWWKDILKLDILYRGVATCDSSRGYTIGFRGDLIVGDIHSLKYPNLFEFAKDPCISLFNLRQTQDLLGCFKIPMSRAAYNDFLALCDQLHMLPHINPDDKDSWSFIWGSPNYSSSKFYQHQYKELNPKKALVWIWETKCILTFLNAKHKECFEKGRIKFLRRATIVFSVI
jgi:hypothetical protein